MSRSRTPAPSLTELFHPIVLAALEDLDLADAAVADYLTGLLTRCALSEELWALASGARLDGVADHLRAIRARRAGDAPADVVASARLEQQLGDHALFMSGIFRNHVEGNGHLDYYIAEGSRSYWTVSELDLSLYRAGFILFQELSKKFEYYSGALDYTRKAYFAAQPGEDPFAGFLRQIEGWIKVNLTEN